MVINCFNFYMKVVLIGIKMVGEYVVIKFFVYLMDWFILNLVVCNVYNVEEKLDYVIGFKFIYEYNEDFYLSIYLFFGNMNEILLNVVLKIMSGIMDK